MCFTNLIAKQRDCWNTNQASNRFAHAKSHEANTTAVHGSCELAAYR